MATNKMDAEEFQFPDEKEETSAAADDFEIGRYPTGRQES